MGEGSPPMGSIGFPRVPYHGIPWAPKGPLPWDPLGSLGFPSHGILGPPIGIFCCSKLPFSRIRLKQKSKTTPMRSVSKS